MKILFYIEQYPIRETYTQHAWIINKILNMITDEYLRKRASHPLSEVKILMNSYQKKSSNQGMIKNLSKFIINTSAEEEERVKAYKKNWDINALNEWKLLMNGEGTFSELTQSILERVYNEIYQYDVIVYWGTNGAIKNFSKKCNIPSVAMELGCTRAPFTKSVYFDFNGVNGNAYTNLLDIEEIENKISLDDIRSYVDVKLAFNLNWEGVYKFVDTKYAKELYEDPSKNILIPLQMTDDSNIINFAKYSTMYEFLLNTVPSLTSKGYRCFIKPHPLGLKENTLDFIKQDYKMCYDYISNIENVYWIDDIDSKIDYLAFLNLFKAVMVINSSLGFESLFLKKVIVPFGKSPYNINNLLPSFEDFLDDKIVEKEYFKNIEKIINIILFYYLKKEEDAFEFVNFINNISLNIEMMKLKEKKSLSEFVKYHSKTKTYFKMDEYFRKSKNELIKNIKPKPIDNINARIFKKYRNSKLQKKMQYVKKVPLVSIGLLYFKNNILKWKIENV
jgi:hypothetical protein